MKIIYKKYKSEYYNDDRIYLEFNNYEYNLKEYYISELLYLKIKHYYLNKNLNFNSAINVKDLSSFQKDFEISGKITKLLGK